MCKHLLSAIGTFHALTAERLTIGGIVHLCTGADSAERKCPRSNRLSFQGFHGAGVTDLGWHDTAEILLQIHDSLLTVLLPILIPRHFHGDHDLRHRLLPWGRGHSALPQRQTYFPQQKVASP